MKYIENYFKNVKKGDKVVDIAGNEGYVYEVYANKNFGVKFIIDPR